MRLTAGNQGLGLCGWQGKLADRQKGEILAMINQYIDGNWPVGALVLTIALILAVRAFKCRYHLPENLETREDVTQPIPVQSGRK